MKEDSFRLKDNFLFEKLPNIIIPNFQQDNDDISIFTQSIADSIEKEIEFLIDYIEVAGNKNLTDKEIQFEDFIEDKNNEEQAFGPKIEFDNIKHDNSFDSLEYDLCFELKSQIFYSVLNEEEKREIDNSKLEKVDSRNLNNSKIFLKKLINDSPQIPKNLNVKESPFIFKFEDSKTKYPNCSGNLTNVVKNKKTFRSNNFNSDNSLINKKNAFCCSTKQKTKITNNSIFSNILFTVTKKSTNISLKSLKLNDSLSRWRRKRNLTLNKSEETFYSRKEKINCMCQIF